MYKIGIDLGGTKIEGVILDLENRIVFRMRQKTKKLHGYESLIRQISTLYRTLVTKIDAAPHSLGICTPGTIDRITGQMRFCNIECMNGRTPQLDLSNETGVAITLTNDANSFALAEARIGAGRAEHFVFGMVLGTGCGGGLVLGGNIWEGRNGIAGEWGHTTLFHEGHACYCGRTGCVERYLSGTAIEQAYHAISGRMISVSDILDARSSGDPDAATVMEEFIEAFGLATANLIKIFDPDIIVLGGGLSNIPDICSIGTKRILENIMGESIDARIVGNQLGDSAGALGAALNGGNATK